MLEVVFLDVGRDVVDLCGAEHRTQREHRRAVLHRRLRIERALRVHQQNHRL